MSRRTMLPPLLPEQQGLLSSPRRGQLLPKPKLVRELPGGIKIYADPLMPKDVLRVRGRTTLDVHIVDDHSS